MASLNRSSWKAIGFLFFGFLAFNGLSIFFSSFIPDLANAYRLSTAGADVINFDPLIGSFIATNLLTGIGLTGIFYLLYPKNIPLPEKQVLLQDPSLYNNEILPVEKSLRWIYLATCVFYNGVTIPLLFTLPRHISTHKYLAALLLVWVAFGGFVFIWQTFLKFREWNRYGPAPFYMDPFPGSIGGDIGGYVDIKLPCSTDAAIKAQILSRRIERDNSDDSGSDNTILWQTSGLPQTTIVGDATRVWIKFDIPSGLDETKKVRRYDYIWQLKLDADVRGVNFSRCYEIPVYATGNKSRHIESSTTENPGSIEADYNAIEKISIIEQNNGGTEWLQPAGRDPHQAITVFFIGVGFAAFGTGGYLAQAPIILIIAFCLVGLGMMLTGIYIGANSLILRVDGDIISRWRKVFTFTMSHQQFHRQDIIGIFISRGMQSNEMADSTAKCITPP